MKKLITATILGTMLATLAYSRFVTSAPMMAAVVAASSASAASASAASDAATTDSGMLATIEARKNRTPEEIVKEYDECMNFVKYKLFYKTEWYHQTTKHVRFSVACFVMAYK